METKKDYWQYIRGLCILAVIMIHSSSGQTLDFGSGFFYMFSVFRGIISFPVPVFFFLSGYFVNREKCLADRRSYLIKRGKRLVIPYLFWSGVYLLVSFFTVGDELCLADYIVRLFTGMSAGHLYYMIVMIQLTVLTPYLLPFIKEKSVALWLFTPAALVVTYIVGISRSYIPWSCDTLFPIWFVFYLMGLKLGNDSREVERLFAVIGKPVFVLPALLLNVLEIIVLMRFDITPDLAYSQNRLFSFIYSIAVIAYFYNRREDHHPENRAILWLGNHSYSLFLSHMLMLKLTDYAVVSPLGLGRVMSIIVLFAGTMIFSVILVAVLDQILKRLRMIKIFKYFL